MPAITPWVDYNSNQIANIGSTPTSIFVATHKSIIDSIVITNITNKVILLTVKIFRNPVSSHFVINLPIAAYGKQEIINTNFQNNIGVSTTDTALYLINEDELRANSDFSGSLFDCIVSYREILEIM